MTLDNLQLHTLDLVVEEAIERHNEGDGGGEDMGLDVRKKCCSVVLYAVIRAVDRYCSCLFAGTAKTR